MADPRWREIADDLRRRIERGEFAEADPAQQRAPNQLPTESQLQAQYESASRNTVRQAIEFLVSHRLVDKRAGRGTFVVEQLQPFVTNLTVGRQSETVGYHEGAKREGRKARTSEPHVRMALAGEWLARTLGVEQGEQLIMRHQERFIDDRAFSLQTSYYPMAFVNSGATDLLAMRDIPNGAIAYLKETIGVEEAGTADRFSARTPTPDETTFFRLPEVGGVAILVHRRTTFDKDGHPIRVTVTTYPADRNEFEIVTGRVPPRPSLPREKET